MLLSPLWLKKSAAQKLFFWFLLRVPRGQKIRCSKLFFTLINLKKICASFTKFLKKVPLYSLLLISHAFRIYNLPLN